MARPKGTPNKKTHDVMTYLAILKCDPLKGMAQIASGEVPCAVCRGKGRTRYQPSLSSRLINGQRVYVVAEEEDDGDTKLKERICLSCYGSGKEVISPDLRGKMYAELAQYIAPKRKAIEHSGPRGESLELVLLQRLRAGRERARGIEQQPKEEKGSL